VVLTNTPLELYNVQGVPVLVKREDLCAPPPGPSFSKVRGVMAHLLTSPEGVIGVLDTYHSKAGQAVAWACRELGKSCVDFWPYYKAEIKAVGEGGDIALREPQQRARQGQPSLPSPQAALPSCTIRPRRS
jgi:threonine dehydratase